MTWRREWFVAIGLAVVATLTVVVWVSDDDDGRPGTTTTTVAAPSSSTTTATVRETTAIWPFPGDAPFDDGVSAAQSFAVEFLGFTDPVFGEFQQGDARSGEVAVRPTGTGPMTTIFVRQLSGDETWSVLGAATETIELTAPEVGSTVSSPVRVAGRALAFEGNVQVEVREDGRLDPIGSGFVTGGGDVMRPFEGLVAFRRPASGFGSIVLLTRSAADGRVWEAGAIRVALATEG